MKNEEKGFGIIVGRFQTDELTIAHSTLIQKVFELHNKVIIFVGVSEAINTRSNPLDFNARRLMILEKFPDAIILPIKDQNSDEKWSELLDDKISEIVENKPATLYGGRDSFIPSYKGKFKTIQIETGIPEFISATHVREKISDSVGKTKDFRIGVISAAYSRYPTSFQTVDLIVVDNTKKQVLFGRKKNETKFRMIGGFVSPTDNSLESAARREFMEETGNGCEISEPKYFLSKRINDFRYRKEVDKILTSVFISEYIYGYVVPSDDISELRWFSFDEIKKEGWIIQNIQTEHQSIIASFVGTISK